MSILIEFSGTPDAGKTTLLKSLYSIFNKSGYNTILLGEASGKTLPPHNLRGSLGYNEWVGQNACEGILNAMRQNSDVLLVDRGVLDFRFWNYFYEKTGKATPEEVKKLQAKPPFNNIELVPDLFVAVTVSIEEAQKRNPSLSKKVDWVQEHNRLFEQFYENYKGTKEKLDTTTFSKDAVVSNTIEIINAHFPKLHINSKMADGCEIEI